ncbi:MAG: hypothetical protein KAI79_14025 [Bacteroidales bacterium]|nr:hypothetical protein [Bacteroidales bacterium]
MTKKETTQLEDVSLKLDIIYGLLSNQFNSTTIANYITAVKKGDLPETEAENLPEVEKAYEMHVGAVQDAIKIYGVLFGDSANKNIGSRYEDRVSEIKEAQAEKAKD